MIKDDGRGCGKAKARGRFLVPGQIYRLLHVLGRKNQKIEMALFNPVCPDTERESDGNQRFRKSPDKRLIIRSAGNQAGVLPLPGMKNYLGQTLWLAVLVLILLGSLSLIPAGWAPGGLSLRKMDIFADIRPDQPDVDSTVFEIPDTAALLTDSLLRGAPADSSMIDTFVISPAVDTSLFGKVFEDYTPGQTGLARFFGAVDSIRPFGRTVRIAFIGDSFVEGDILLGDLRDTLQTAWGGNGVGFVPITSEVARFKRTLVHRYEKWETYSIVKNHESGQPFGINGFVYRPRDQAFVHYEGANYFHHTRNWTRFHLFYQSQKDAAIVWQEQNGAPHADILPASPERLGMWQHDQNQPPVSAFALRFEQPDSNLLLYGASLESGPGIYIDNFSVRGNTGGRLKKIKPELARQFNALLRYDLIIVQLGLNAVTPRMDNIRWYKAELTQTFVHLQKCFPNQPILVLSVADRAGKIDGELKTMPSVYAISSMQRDLARQFGFLYFDLFHGMGGPGTMIDFAGRKPALANKDYTHLTHEGGRVMGLQFARLLFEAQTRYRERKAPAPSR